MIFELDRHTRACTVSGASMLSTSIMRLGAPESCGRNGFDDYMVCLQDFVSLRFSAGCFVYPVRGRMVL